MCLVKREERPKSVLFLLSYVHHVPIWTMQSGKVIYIYIYIYLLDNNAILSKSHLQYQAHCSIILGDLTCKMQVKADCVIYPSGI